MRISKEGVAFIASFESFVSKPYLDTGHVPTIGYGTTIYPNGKKVKMSDKPITEAEALAYKMYHIEKRCYPYIDVVLNQNQFDAICSFVYNVGGEAFRTSTLRKKIIANRFRMLILSCCIYVFLSSFYYNVNSITRHT